MTTGDSTMKMNDKVLAYILGTAAMAACCIGVPLLLVFLSSVGFFAWFADNSIGVLALVTIVAGIVLFRRDQKKRRHPARRRAQAVERSAADKSWPSSQQWRQRSTDE